MAWTRTVPQQVVTANIGPGDIRATVSIDPGTGHVLAAVSITTDTAEGFGVDVDCDAEALTAAEITTFKGLLAKVRNTALAKAGFQGP